MLKKSQFDVLAGRLKIDSQILADAINSEDEQELTLPDGVVSFTPEELTSRDGNVVEKAKPGIKTAAVEEAAKAQIRALGLQLPDEAKKDFGTVLAGFKSKVLADAKIKPDEALTALQGKLSAKDALIETERQRATQIQEDYDAFKFRSGVNVSVLAKLSDSKTLSKEDKLTLFDARYKVGANEAGVQIVTDKRTGKVMEDDKLNPLPLDNVVETFDAQYVDSGAGGRGGHGGAGNGAGGGEDMDAIHKQLESEGLSKAADSTAYFKRMNELLPKN